MIDIVNGLLVRDTAVLMAKRSIVRRNYANCWSFPGGHVETGERLIDAIHRELMEKFGIQAGVAQPLDFTINYGDVAFHFFHVTFWAGTPVNMSDEPSEIRWASLRNATQSRRFPANFMVKPQFTFLRAPTNTA